MQPCRLVSYKEDTSNNNSWLKSIGIFNAIFGVSIEKVDISTSTIVIILEVT